MIGEIVVRMIVAASLVAAFTIGFVATTIVTAGLL